MKHASLNGRRVLVVEDEVMISMLVEDTLEDNGCIIIGPYTNVPDTLKALSGLDFDAAVLDVNLRGEKIYPVAEILEARSIPFLLLSGYGKDAVPANRTHWKACSKPFRMEELARLLAEQIDAIRPG